MSKHAKRLLLIVLIILVPISSASAMKASTIELNDEELATLKNGFSTELYVDLRNKFGGHETEDMPLDYGGAYIDDQNALVMGFTGNVSKYQEVVKRQEVASLLLKYESELSEDLLGAKLSAATKSYLLKTEVKLKQVKYSLRILENTTHIVWDMRDKYGILEVAMDEKRNCIVVGVANEGNLLLVTDFLTQDLGVEKDIFHIVIAEEAQEEALP